MFSHAFPFPDPNYRSDPAAYLRDAVEGLTHYAVVPAAQLRSMLEIDHLAREIRVRPGQAFRTFHALLGRATLYVIGGHEWAPEFVAPKPRLHVVPAIPSFTPPKQAIAPDVESLILTRG